MDDRPIWTREDLVRFTHDESEEIRSWAWSRLARHHPEEAGRQAARGVFDPSFLIAMEALLAFERHPTPEAVKAIEELRGRDDLKPPLREAIDVAQGRSPKREPEPEHDFDRLADAPGELKRRAAAMLLGKSDLDHHVAAAALSRQEHRWATDVILDNFALLLTRADDTEVWMTLDELRDPRTLPAILAAWVPGQYDAARLYACIHHLAGLSGPLPEGIVRDLEDDARYQKHKDAFHAAHPGEIWPGTRRNAACRACRRTGEYERAIPYIFEKLIPVLAARGKRLPMDESTVLVCKFCGAREVGRLESLRTSGAPAEDDHDEDHGEDEDDGDGRDKN